MRILTLLWFFVFLTPAAQAQGVLSFDAETREFTPFVVGKTVSHTFRFKNTGDAPIVVSKVDASCGCTRIRWSQDPVLPQDSGFVSVSYDSKGHEGNFFKNIHVYSNAKRSDYPLLIRGVALPDPEEAPLAVLPADTFDLGGLVKWTQTKYRIKVRNEGKNYLTISSITSACNCVHLVSYAGMQIREDQEKEIELMYNPQQTGDPSIEPIILHTNSVKQPEITIYLRSRVVEKRIDLEKEDG